MSNAIKLSAPAHHDGREESDPLADAIDQASGLVTQFTTFNGMVQISQIDPNSTTDHLKPGVYTLRFSMMSGYYLEVEHTPKVPSELYGNVVERANLIINTYKDRSVSTGVLAIGNKGSGKTLLTTIISSKLVADGVPVILIPAGYSGAGFNSFLAHLGNCCLIFDEFAKLYDNDKNAQNDLLTLFDGTKSTKRLILLTENDEYNINSFLLGRPGRILYKFNYGALALEVVEEVLDANGIKDEAKAQMLHYSTDIDGMSMDILKALIDEHLRYPETDLRDIVERLNVTTTSSFTKYEFIPEKIELSDAGKEIGIDDIVVNGQYVYMITKENKATEIKYYTSKTWEDGESNSEYDPNFKFNLLTSEYSMSFHLRKDRPKAVKDGKYLYLLEYASVVGEWKEIRPIYNYGGLF